MHYQVYGHYSGLALQVYTQQFWANQRVLSSYKYVLAPDALAEGGSSPGTLQSLEG